MPKEGVFGEVVFLVQHPTEDRSKLDVGRQYKGTQSEFVDMLRTGCFKSISHLKL